MVSFDIVADTITRLRNAQMIKRVSTEVRFSKKNICLDSTSLFIRIFKII